MGIWDGVNHNSVASADSGFQEFKVGDNEAFIKSVQQKWSQSDNEMLVITFANDDGAEIRHYIVDGEYKLQKLKQLCIAFDIPFGNQDVQSWVGKRGIVVCKRGKPNSNGNVYNEVSFLRPKPGGSNVNRSSANSTQSQPQSQQNHSAEQGQSDDGFTDDIPF